VLESSCIPFSHDTLPFAPALPASSQRPQFSWRRMNSARLDASGTDMLRYPHTVQRCHCAQRCAGAHLTIAYRRRQRSLSREVEGHGPVKPGNQSMPADGAPPGMRPGANSDRRPARSGAAVWKMRGTGSALCANVSPPRQFSRRRRSRDVFRSVRPVLL